MKELLRHNLDTKIRVLRGGYVTTSVILLQGLKALSEAAGKLQSSMTSNEVHQQHEGTEPEAKESASLDVPRLSSTEVDADQSQVLLALGAQLARESSAAVQVGTRFHLFFVRFCM